MGSSNEIKNPGQKYEPKSMLRGLRAGGAGSDTTNVMPQFSRSALDSETQVSLRWLEEQERLKSEKIPNVQTVWVIVSAKGMVLDASAIRTRIELHYPGAKVFITDTIGKPLGEPVPAKVDLALDLTGPGQWQNIFFARKVKRKAKFVVGRNAGLFRKKIYNKLFDEKAAMPFLPSDMLDKEFFVQREVFALAGISITPQAPSQPDRGKEIALELPPLQK